MGKAGVTAPKDYNDRLRVIENCEWVIRDRPEGLSQSYFAVETIDGYSLCGFKLKSIEATHSCVHGSSNDSCIVNITSQNKFMVTLVFGNCGSPTNSFRYVVDIMYVKDVSCSIDALKYTFPYRQQLTGTGIIY